MDVWQEVDEPWQASLELAWEAYLAGTISVGAVVPRLEDALPRLLDCL